MRAGLITLLFVVAQAAFTLDESTVEVDAQVGEKYNHKLLAGGDTLVFGVYNLGTNGGLVWYQHNGTDWEKDTENLLGDAYREAAISPSGETVAVITGAGPTSTTIYTDTVTIATLGSVGVVACLTDQHLMVCDQGVSCVVHQGPTWGATATVGIPAGASPEWGSRCLWDGDEVWIFDKGYNSNMGAAWTYQATGTPIQTPLTIPGLVADDLSFTHARILGDMAVVAVPGDDTRAPNAGAMVFLRRDIGGAGFWGVAEMVPNDRTASGVLFGNNDVHFLREDRVAVPVSSYGSGEVWIYGFQQGSWDNLIEVISPPYANGIGTDWGIESAASESHLVVAALHPSTTTDTGPIHSYRFPECDPGGDQCVDNEVCSLDRTCAGPVACVENWNCAFQQKFPVCVDGICRELYDDTCGYALECDIKAHRNYAAANGVGFIPVTYDSVVDSWNLTQMLVDHGDPWVTVDYDDSVVLLVDPNITDAQYIEAVEAKVCGPVPCDITVERTVAEITITMHADLHPESLELLTVNGTFSADLVTRLGDYLGTTVEFAGVNTTGYTVVNSWYTVEGDGLTPVPAEEANNLVALVINVTHAVNAQGFAPGPTVGQIDRCGNRNCNYHGTCNTTTGVCDCTNVNYWGLNCETLVTCERGWKKNDDQYCVCPYPWGGLRCELDSCACGP